MSTFDKPIFFKCDTDPLAIRLS